MLAPRWPSLTLAICLSLAFVGIARSPAYAAAGDLDPTFGGTGKVTTQFGPYWVDSANSVLVQPDGRIIAVGLSASCSCDYRFALARYNVDGTLDTTFGSAGLVRTRVR